MLSRRRPLHVGERARPPVPGRRWAALAATVVAASTACGGDGSSHATPPTRDASADDASGTCAPKTCAQLGAECGKALDGCGSVVACGDCPAELHCGGGGVNRCGTNLCKPKTCTQLETSCGLASDQCADVLDCGGCPAPQVCGGGTKPNQCGCLPKTCVQLDANCSTAPDGCGGVVECGACLQGQTCGAAGPNRCGSGTCAVRTCGQLGASCGIASDGCADVLDCGTCSAPSVCGGSGTVNQCGCTSKTCAQLEAS